MVYNCARYPDKECPAPGGCVAAEAADAVKETARRFFPKSVDKVADATQKRLGMTGYCGIDNPPSPKPPAPELLPFKPRRREN